MYMTLQTIWGYVHMFVYDTGRDMMAKGIIPTGNMLPEVAFIKLGWALGQTDDLEKVKPLLDFTENLIPEMKTQSEQFEIHEIVQIIEKLSEYEKTIKTTSQQHIWLEVALISICHRQDIQVIIVVDNPHQILDVQPQYLEDLYVTVFEELQEVKVKPKAKPKATGGKK